MKIIIVLLILTLFPGIVEASSCRQPSAFIVLPEEHCGKTEKQEKKKVQQYEDRIIIEKKEKSSSRITHIRTSFH